MTDKLSTATRRLRQRQSASSKNSAYTRPGSMNKHKSAPLGNGRRTKAKIKADSREATSS